MSIKNAIYGILGLVVIVAIIGGSWYYYNFNKYAPTSYVKDSNEGSYTVDTATGSTSTTTPTFTMSKISEHNDESSCYSAILGSVYDLTMWVNLHPGGKKGILAICGINGTDLFMKKHNAGSKQMNILARYKIGVLAEENVGMEVSATSSVEKR